MATKARNGEKKPSERQSARNHIGDNLTGNLPAKTKTRIMVVDDHSIVRDGYRSLIQREPDLEICAEASGQAEAIQKAFADPPEMVIVDISLEEGSGLDLIRELKSQWPGIKILAVSAHDEMLFAERALHAGALGYINKREASERLIDAIRQVLQGRVSISEKMTEYVLNQYTGFTTPVDKSPVERLSDRELEVFGLLGQGKTTHQIAEALYLSPKTIETYRDNIKQKLHLRNAAQLIQHAVQWDLENK